jgi:isoleucyl-tRNA synthetase
MEQTERYVDKLAKYILAAAGIGIFCAICWFFRSVIIYILAAVVVSLIAKPVMSSLQKIRIKGKKAPDWFLAAFSLTLVITVILTVLTLIIPIVTGILKGISFGSIENAAGQISVPLANLNDFNPDTDMVEVDELYEIDKWALSRLNNLAKVIREGYDTFEFHTVYHSVNNFCTNDLSKLYIDITKDRVYVEKSDSKARRSAQTAMYLIISGMTRLIAPMLSFTAEEIWQAMPHSKDENKESVFLNLMPEYSEEMNFGDVSEHWNKLFTLRDDVMKALELARASKLIGKSLDAKVTIYTNNDEHKALLDSFKNDLATVFIVSQAMVSSDNAPEGAFSETESGIAVLVDKADGHKCDRCWTYSTEGVHDEDGFICERCRKILE